MKLKYRHQAATVIFLCAGAAISTPCPGGIYAVGVPGLEQHFGGMNYGDLAVTEFDFGQSFESVEAAWLHLVWTRDGHAGWFFLGNLDGVWNDEPTVPFPIFFWAV